MSELDNTQHEPMSIDAAEDLADRLEETTDSDASPSVSDRAEEVPEAIEASAASDIDTAEASERQPENNAARTVSALFAEGVASMKEMNAAHRAHSEARDELERLDNTIEARKQELEHRLDITSRYAEIVTQASQRKDDADQKKAAAEARQAEIAAKIAELKAKLEKMREEDTVIERRLKSALDAAEDKERSARESGKRLQRRLDDAQTNLDRAVKERDDGIAAAQRAVKSAESHLATLNAEYIEIQRNPSANSAGYSVRKRELEDEISDATEALRNAKNDVPRVEDETQAAIANAHAAVSEAERPIASAREAFDAVAAAADRARDAYGDAKDGAEKRQKELRSTISDGEKAAKAQQRAAEEAQREADAAQADIDEANDIHAHPEITDALAHALEADRAEREERIVEVEQLAAVEKGVRERTRGARVRLTLAIGGIVLVIVLMLIWTFFAK